jgi:hypothetical protein
LGPLPGGVPGAAAIAEEAGALVTIISPPVGAIGWLWQPLWEGGPDVGCVAFWIV